MQPSGRDFGNSGLLGLWRLSLRAEASQGTILARRFKQDALCCLSADDSGASRHQPLDRFIDLTGAWKPIQVVGWISDKALLWSLQLGKVIWIPVSLASKPAAWVWMFNAYPNCPVNLEQHRKASSHSEVSSRRAGCSSFVSPAAQSSSSADGNPWSQ